MSASTPCPEVRRIYLGAVHAVSEDGHLQVTLMLGLDVVAGRWVQLADVALPLGVPAKLQDTLGWLEDTLLGAEELLVELVEPTPDAPDPVVPAVRCWLDAKAAETINERLVMGGFARPGARP